MINTNAKLKTTPELQKEIISIDIEKIDFNDHRTVKKTIVLQHNVIEFLLTDRQQIYEEYQKLRDEINRLKGEKGIGEKK